MDRSNGRKIIALGADHILIVIIGEVVKFTTVKTYKKLFGCVSAHL